MKLINTVFRILSEKFRLYTGTYRRLPDFIIIGAQKGGTTSLFDYLAQHPDMSLAKRKEIHFFDKNYRKGLNFYKNYFPLNWQGKEKLTGEATPYYLFHPLVAERMSQHLPKVKLIVLLRNPVDRAFSHYQMKVAKKQEPASFEEALRLEEGRLAGEAEKMAQNKAYYSWNYRAFAYQKRGIYADQLERWFKYFDRKQILVLNSEDYFRDYVATLRLVYEFLEIPFFNPQNLEIRNAFTKDSMSAETRQHLKAYFHEHNERLFKLIGVRYNWND